jgi:hypothetical protein
MPINVTGVKQLQKAMRAVDDDLFNEMSTGIKAVMLPIRDKARDYLPYQDEVLSGWGTATASVATANYRAFPAYNYQTAKSGIKYKAGSNKRNRNGFSVTNYVSNESAPGAIYETAGRKNPNGSSGGASLNPDASIQFIQALPEMMNNYRASGRKRDGRLIYRAWAEDSGKVYKKVVDAVEKTANRFNSKQAKAA